MAKNAKAPNSFAGRWRIISMKRWDQVFVDEEEDGCVRKTIGLAHGRPGHRPDHGGAHSFRRWSNHREGLCEIP